VAYQGRFRFLPRQIQRHHFEAETSLKLDHNNGRNMSVAGLTGLWGLSRADVAPNNSRGSGNCRDGIFNVFEKKGLILLGSPLSSHYHKAWSFRVVAGGFEVCWAQLRFLSLIAKSCGGGKVGSVFSKIKSRARPSFST
jgi:hypothetical protein